MNIKIINLTSVISLAIFLFAHAAYAHEDVHLGKTYPIAEVDALEDIHQHLDDLEKNGRLQKIQNEVIQYAKEKGDRPHPLLIPRAIQTRAFKYDTSFTIPYDLYDHKGRVLAHKGERYNPLTIVPLKKQLIFFNGDDEKQVTFVKNLIKKNFPHKLVLTQGSISDATKTFKETIFFDQLGMLSRKFDIQHVPATVSQENDHLRIDEVVL